MLHLTCMFHAVPHSDFTPVEMLYLHIPITTLWKLSPASRIAQEVLDLQRLVTTFCTLARDEHQQSRAHKHLLTQIVFSATK